MIPLAQSVLAVGALSLISLLGIATLSLRQAVITRGLFILISLAAGALLGDAFIHLLPEAFEEASVLTVSFATLGGILAFFVLEKLLNWHHNHGEDEYAPDHAQRHPVGRLVLISDALHNMIDGLAIGIAFLVSPEVGIGTTLAIALHEIPQEIGDFGLLLHAGYTRTKALLFNFVSALTAFIGLGIAFMVGDTVAGFIPVVTAFTAGMFIYIAMSDIVPELQKTKRLRNSVLQIAMMLVGIIAMALLLVLEV
ncbi:MAG TPA: ZIP family metal transporter [Candidatus Paceibacterota bacterium]|nr:ZIP family metal transporter [Candidatus Paceibacterota bacterium]